MPGSMIDIRDAAGNAVPAWLAMPDTGEGPGVVMGMDIHGMRPTMHKLAQQFADQGYITIVPDLFWNIEMAERVENGVTRRDYQSVLDWEQCKALVGSAADALRAMPECNGRIGVMGYCLGGGLAMHAALHLGVDAASSYYGTRIHWYCDEMADVTCPILLHIAKSDPTYSSEDRDRILAAAEPVPDVHPYVYDAPHGFANMDNDKSYDTAAAQAANARTFALFERMKG